MQEYFEISERVKKAKEEGKPIVALESTIISHGMPYPQNVETALMLEEEVIKNGAVPATMGIINGVYKVGLSKEEIEILGKEGLKVMKCSRRDIPYAISKKINAATTVAATMIGASMAGIKIFATGGLGGVHRGAELTFDISADLEELAITNVAVVCAGCKSILNIGLTLEYLETKSVPVIGYKTNDMPAFYTQKSGHKTTYKLDSPEEIASFLKVKEEMGLEGGSIIANPIPLKYSMDKREIDKAINDAVREAARLGIKGKETTPYLLDKVKQITKGKSLESNIALAKNNAALAAKIACKL